VAVVRLDFDGYISQIGQLSLSERLIGGLAAAGFQVFAGAVVRDVVSKDPALESCKDPGCHRTISELLGAEYLVVGKIRVNQKNYEITLDLLSGRDGKSVGLGREHCELCGIQEVGDMMDRVTSSLRAYLDANVTDGARIAVETQPVPAEVTLDGRSVGTTPLSFEVPAGQHELAFAATGYQPTHRKLDLSVGTNETVRVDLTPNGGGVLGTGGRATASGPWRVFGWSGLIVGALATASGLVALSYDKTAVACPAGAAGECHRDTGIIAGVLLGAGGMALVSGGLFLYFSRAVAPATTGEVASSGWLLGATKRF
jgi:hypothetical protein